MARKLRLAILLGLSLRASTAFGATGKEPSPWAPYEFLIGAWDVSSRAGGPPVAAARFRWGPNRAYIWYAGSLMLDGVERPHFEGLLVWNGVRRNLDMLVSMDLEHGLVQEQGVVRVEPDGTVVREITATYAEGTQPIGRPKVGSEGATAHFRQTFRPSGPDRVLTEVLRQTDRGWTATFPGSDELVMTRKTKA